MNKDLFNLEFKRDEDSIYTILKDILMRFIKYLWSKLLKKIRGSAIVNSTVHHTSKIYSGSHIVNSTIGKDY